MMLNSHYGLYSVTSVFKQMVQTFDMEMSLLQPRHVLSRLARFVQRFNPDLSQSVSNDKIWHIKGNLIRQNYKFPKSSQNQFISNMSLYLSLPPSKPPEKLSLPIQTPVVTDDQSDCPQTNIVEFKTTLKIHAYSEIYILECDRKIFVAITPKPYAIHLHGAVDQFKKRA